jgi:hypothetical protein
MPLKWASHFALTSAWPLGLNFPRNWRAFTLNDEVLLVFFWQLYSYQSAALYTTTYIKQEQVIKIENDRQNNCCDR